MMYYLRLFSHQAARLLSILALIGCLNILDSVEDDAEGKKALLTAHTISITSSLDQSQQKAFYYAPPEAHNKNGQPVPLLVALHSWSGDCAQGFDYLPHAQQRKWVLIAPDFRGVNLRPEACASPLAIQDVMDAVAYAQQHANIDDNRIYVMGGSGGGHMTLMMSTHAPQVWAAASAWVPIADLSTWYAENNREQKTRYATMMEAVCGGPPNAQTNAQYHARSPIFYLQKAAGLPMDLNTGIHDGHTGSVPVSHALHAFNKLATANGLAHQQVATGDIDYMVETQKIPASLAAEQVDDPERKKAVLFRRIAGPVRITVFAGGHESDIPAALNWLARQVRGQPANFQLGKIDHPNGGRATEVPP